MTTRRLLAVVSIVFLAAGMSSGALGPALHDLAAQARTDIVSAGAMFTAIFATSLVAQVGVALALGPLGQKTILLAGMVAYMLGIVGIIFSPSLTLLLAASAVIGLGNSSLLLVGNVIAAQASAGAGPLNLVNAMFGVGAILSPALVSLSLLQLGNGIPALWSAPLVMSAALALLLTWQAPPGPAPAAQSSAGRGRLRRMLGSATIWKVSALVVLEVAVEMGISAWLPTLLQRATGLTLAQGAAVMSLYWLLVTLARFAAAWASRHVSALALLAGTIGSACLGGLLLVAGLAFASPLLSISATAVLGCSIGPILPTALSILRSAYPADAGLATGFAFGCSNLSAALVPPFLGAVVQMQGAVAGAGGLVAMMLGMGACLFLIARGAVPRPPGLIR